MKKTYSQIEFDPTPADDWGHVWYLSLSECQGKRQVILADNEGNRLEPIPMEVFQEIVKHVKCWKCVPVTPFDVEVPF